ncbi:MAG TPA: ABC transporter permease [Blastocatellia bacterium]|nr:ABC transporter permease [Blastocatellia bacterium]
METVLQDLRYAIRASLNRPGFMVIVVLALAIGIGANTAIFSVVNAILLRPLPYKNPDRIVMVWMSNGKLAIDQDWHSYPNYVDYRDQNSTFEEVAAFNDRSFNLTGNGEPVRVAGAWSTANLFAVLGVDPLQGRAFTVEEEEPGKDRVAVISYGLWQRRFGSDPGVIGQPISLNGVDRTVIGVMPASFAFPQKETDVWVPLATSVQNKQARGAFWLKAVGRLKPGVTIEQARADMGTIANQLLERFPQIMESYGVNLVPLHEQVTGKVRTALLVLLAAVAFVLLIACANVANLLLARAAAREREIAIRTALGASRRRIVRQLLTESVLLALVGGVLGLLLAIWGLDALKAISPANVPRLDQIGIDGRVLAFTLTVSLLTGIIFGLVPALQASKPDLNESLKEGGRGSSEGRRGKHVRSLLVVSEIALSLVLLIGAGLLIKSFIHLQKFDLGFNPDNLLTLRVQLAGTKYRENPQVVNFFQQALERMRNVPGVQSVGAISTIFLSDTPNSTNFTIEGRPVVTGADSIEVPLDAVTNDYFKVMGIPLLKGRFFDERDRAGSLPVAIVNETFAKRFFEGEDPLGKRYCYGQPSSDGKTEWLTIVGVVGDMRRTGYDKAARPETFMAQDQNPDSALTIVARTAGDPASYAPALRDAVWAVDKDQSVFSIKTMDATLAEMTAERRFNMLLLGIFAAVAMVLAGVGIYGVMSYSVTQRMHELGIRIALGASQRDVLRLVIGQATRLALIGVGAGLIAAFFLTRLMASLLYGVSATDFATFLLISSLLTGVSLAASFVPARRAMKVDPMVALRYE